MNQVELKKYEFDCRGTPRLTALPITSGPSRLHCMDKNSLFSMAQCKNSKKFYNRTSKKNITKVWGKNEFENRDESNLLKFQEFSANHDYKAGTKLVVF